MKSLQFLVAGKNQEILDVLKRIIENNAGWNAVITNDEAFCEKYLAAKPVDILLLSSGLSEEFECEIQLFVTSLNKGIKVIEHYGGGSGLLKNEVYQLFPELNDPS